MSTDNKTSSGISFTSLLLIAFIVLKLCNVINWSWWWVLSPAWIPLGVAVTLWIIYKIAVSMTTKSEHKELKKMIGDRNGRLKSKWQERLEQMQEAQKRQQEKRNP